MQRSWLTWAGVALHLAAIACIVVVLVRWDSGGIEGAVFDRSVTAPEVVGYAPIAPFDPVPWLVAALVLLIAGLAAFVADVVRAARRR
jgi:hypothetical protein